jgi:cyclophilin family peptidyl-prolyl cis-trans isomerase
MVALIRVCGIKNGGFKGHYFVRVFEEVLIQGSDVVGEGVMEVVGRGDGEILGFSRRGKDGSACVENKALGGVVAFGECLVRRTGVLNEL